LTPRQKTNKQVTEENVTGSVFSPACPFLQTGTPSCKKGL